ncbi:MAG: hypothetical protein ACYC54_10415 [Sedimentisphaerales bacterium]
MKSKKNNKNHRAKTPQERDIYDELTKIGIAEGATNPHEEKDYSNLTKPVLNSVSASSAENERHPIKPPDEKDKRSSWLTWILNISALGIIPLAFWAGKLQTIVDNHSLTIEKQETRFSNLDEKFNIVKVDLAKIEVQLENVKGSDNNLEVYKTELNRINELLKSLETATNEQAKELVVLKGKFTAIDAIITKKAVK